MNPTNVPHDEHYQRAIAAIKHTLKKLHGCSPEEREQLQDELGELQQMLAKLTAGQVEIAVFGEISTGKSALINALVGDAVTEVDVQGGWTKEVWQVPWSGSGYRVPGLADSQLVLVDTPGLNEIGGASRSQMAQLAAQRADVILFVTDSDLNDIEFSALAALAEVQKPIILVLNKMDLYAPEQRERLITVLRDDRLRDLIPAANIVMAVADPRELEYVIESADGRQRREWRKPPTEVADLKVRILELLQADGKELLALNAALYAADKNDRITSIRVRFRDRRARQVIASYAAVKAVAVALNPVAIADVIGGSAVDGAMVVTLAHVYGLEMSTVHAQRLIASILKAAGWVMLGEATTHLLSSAFKGLTLGYGTVLTALPQGAAAGYGSFIVGQAAKYYFEHGSTWGGESPKMVVRRILRQTDKTSVLEQLKNQLRGRMRRNRYSVRS